MFGRRVGRWLLASSVVAGAAGVSGSAGAEPSAGFPLPPEENAPAAPPAAPAAPPAAPTPPSIAPSDRGPSRPRAPAALPEMLAPTAPSAPGERPVERGESGSERSVALPPPPGFPLLLPYRPGVPVPRGYHVERRPATGLIVSGGVTLGVGYLTALGIGLHHGFGNGTGWTVLPVVGPWAAIGARNFECDINGIDDVDNLDDINTEGTANEAEGCIRRAQSEAISIALLAVDGMIQATGAILLVAGLASGVDELVWDGLGDVRVSARGRPEGGGELRVFGKF